MHIRRVIELDGGNHLVSDKLQYRQVKGDKWKDVQTLSLDDATLADMKEGLIVPEDFSDYGEAAVKYWKDMLSHGETPK